MNAEHLDENALWRLPLFPQSTPNLHGLVHPIRGAQVVHQLDSLRAGDVKRRRDIVKIEKVTIEQAPPATIMAGSLSLLSMQFPFR